MNDEGGIEIEDNMSVSQGDKECENSSSSVDNDNQKRGSVSTFFSNKFNRKNK